MDLEEMTSENAKRVKEMEFETSGMERESGNLGKRGQASSQGDNPSRLQGE
jgi:hypothetical protein